MAEEGLTQTKFEKIHIAKPMEINMDDIKYKLGELNNLLENCTNEQRTEIKRVFQIVCLMDLEDNTFTILLTENPPSGKNAF